MSTRWMARALLLDDPCEARLNYHLLGPETPDSHPAVPTRNGNVTSSIISLLATTMGGGLLALPYAFAKCGLLVGVGFLLLSALATGYSLVILVACSNVSGEASFEGNVRFYLGRKWLIVLRGALYALLLLTASAVFVVVMDLGPKVLGMMFYPSPLLHPLMVGSYAMALMFYFSAQDSLHALRYTSFAVLCCIAYFLYAIVYTFGCDPHVQESVVAINSPSSWFEGVPIMFTAYQCQYNIFKINEEMREDQKDKINKVIWLGILGVVTAVYSVAGLLGYFMLGAGVSGDILTEFSRSDLFSMARGLLALTSLLKLPLLLIPLRISLEETCGLDPRAVDWRGRSAFCLIINLVSFFVACALGSLSKVLDFAGCTAGVVIAFLLPGLLRVRYLQTRNCSSDSRQIPGQVLAWALIVGGILAGTASLASIVFDWDGA
uniref:Amino acid transporter transmembrane domain-containing protein n=1 Tax=Noctiluca scintillans TaxID=2966 RepID=A0A7S1ATL6_NOCSC